MRRYRVRKARLERRRMEWPSPSLADICSQVGLRLSPMSCLNPDLWRHHFPIGGSICGQLEDTIDLSSAFRCG